MNREGGPLPWARRVQVAALVLIFPAIAVAILWPNLSIAMGLLIVVFVVMGCADWLSRFQ